MSEHQVEQVMSYRAEQMRKAERGAVPEFESVADPDGWPYPDNNGLIEDPASPSVWDDGRGPGTAEVIELRDVEVQPGESVCPSCWLIHPVSYDCEAS